MPRELRSNALASSLSWLDSVEAWNTRALKEAYVSWLRFVLDGPVVNESDIYDELYRMQNCFCKWQYYAPNRALCGNLERDGTRRFNSVSLLTAVNRWRRDAEEARTAPDMTVLVRDVDRGRLKGAWGEWLRHILARYEIERAKSWWLYAELRVLHEGWGKWMDANADMGEWTALMSEAVGHHKAKAMINGYRVWSAVCGQLERLRIEAEVEFELEYQAMIHAAESEMSYADYVHEARLDPVDQGKLRSQVGFTLFSRYFNAPFTLFFTLF